MSYVINLRNLCWLSLCAVLSICGIASIILWPKVLEIIFVLGPKSVLYNCWKKLPSEIVTEYRFFNWTNSEHFYNLSVKPKFEELGPYTFIQTEEKADIVWNDNGTVSYRQRKFWYHKGGNLNDVIVGVNYVTLAAATITRHWNYYTRRLIFFTLTPIFRSLISSHTVGELLFEGYREPLIKIAAALPIFEHLNLPEWDRFGWFYQRNGTTDFDGVSNMGTGTNSTLGEIYNWNYNNKTSFFHENCSDVSGFSGQFLPQNLTPDWLLMFSPDLRRKISVKFAGTEMVDGLLGFKYILEDILDNGTTYSENFCFCNGECVPYGMVNLSITRHGFPLFMSLPHFYKADPYYLDLVDGLKPDPKEHEFVVIVEPNTGIPIEIRTRAQLNLLIRPVEGISVVENVSKVFVPVFWTKQNFKLSGITMFLVKLIVKLPFIFNLAGFLMIISSLILMSFLFYKKYKAKLKKQKNQAALTKEQQILLTENIVKAKAKNYT